ncbi:hypothetical protein AFR_30260 [Actinoplanes friuliensis DSM 7358]|uniref:Guanylate cyclase domain-containing protein n=2 Tax=Actinoplanes friuliensis TaxID=196914 RepID=U5W5M9_9ACTN|nr:hypothetical protein AFR_30260 [Actinoplanes friuliensis DSM 7358]
MVADMERYSARSSVLQNKAQTVFLDALDAAGLAADLDRGTWRRQASGDGELAVLPADVDEPALLSAFLLTLDKRLRAYNVERQPQARVRVRVSVHQGLLFPESRNGFAGEAVNTAARLVDAPVLKRALREFPDAAVACIVSDGIHRDVIAGGYEGIRPERFRRLRVVLGDKNFDEWAWLQIVDEDINNLDLQSATAESVPVVSERRPSREVPPGGIQVGDVDNRDGQVAIGHGATATGGVHQRIRFPR